MNNFYKGRRKLPYLKGLSDHAVQQKTTAIRPCLKMQWHAIWLALTSLFINPITLLPKLWKSKAILLIGIALLHMFSLSAQTPRKDSGADGVYPKDLQMGDFVPEDFWSVQHLFYQNGDTIRRDMSGYKGKHIILDFWSLDCGACILTFPKMESLQQEFFDSIVIIPVNSQKKRHNYERFQQFFKHGNRAMPHPMKLPNIIYDSYFAQLFPIDILPHYVWIKPSGMVKAILSADFINRTQIETIIQMEGGEL